MFFGNSRWRLPPSWIFRLCEFGHSGVLTVWYLCSVPNWVKISALVIEIDALMFRRSFDDVTRINFRLATFGHVVILRMAVMHLSVKFCVDIFIQLW